MAGTGRSREGSENSPILHGPASSVNVK